MGDHDGRLVARRQHVPDRGDVLGQPRSSRTGRLTRLAAARQGGRLAGDAPLGQQLSGPVPPPRPVLARTPRARRRPSSRPPRPVRLLSNDSRRTDRYVKTWADGQAPPAADQAAAPRRVHRPRARARAPGPARAAGRRRGHLEPDADLPLRDPRRPAPRDPRTGPPAPGRGLHRPPAPAARRALPDHPGAAPGPRSPGRRASPTCACSAGCTTPRANHSGPASGATATTDWLAPLEEGMRSLGRPELATVVLAVIRGLLMDLDATGDAARTDRAFHDFLATIDGA